MKLEIDVKQALIVSGSIAAGMIIGFSLTNLAIKKAKKELKNEIINKETQMVKEEITKEIKENINIREIKNDIKKEIENSIIDDTLKDMDSKMEDICDKNRNFMAKVEIKLGKYEKTLKRIESDVLDTDARVGKLVNSAIKTMAGVVVKRGDDDED